MARAVREPNKNPMPKICSGQTPPRQKSQTERPALRGIFISYFYSLILSSKWLGFVRFLSRRAISPKPGSARSTSASRYRCICKCTAYRVARYGFYDCYERCEIRIMYSTWENFDLPAPSGGIILHGFSQRRECLYKRVQKGWQNRLQNGMRN